VESLAAVSGVLFSLCIFATLALQGAFQGNEPDNTSSLREITDYYGEHHTGILVGHVVFNFSTFFLILFTASLWRTLKAVEGDPAWLSAVAFGGGLVAAAISSVGNELWASGANIADEYTLTPDVANLIFHLTVVFFVPWVGIVMTLFATAVLTFRTGVFPRWVAWFALVVLVLRVVSQWPVPRDASTIENVLFDYTGPVGAILMLVWIIVVSVILTRRAGAPASAVVVEAR
jgi:hypothetical protein